LPWVHETKAKLPVETGALAPPRHTSCNSCGGTRAAAAGHSARRPTRRRVAVDAAGAFVPLARTYTRTAPKDLRVLGAAASVS